ncbi:serine/threonine-protein phosphatase with EF-hands 1-like [Dipodomys spectabilis]|uniref:serine/threonine-protein phosphatase with EF-hands 1-like n=1 Tax=Dipodomys spectabilis TaxID=105255 RepID=UPI001C54440E|nr:serine/threonine-protein phosphatase with EF-hands 1-like [Dipodomys spectabilis]
MQLSSIFSFMLENYTPIYKENRVLADQHIENNFREFQDRQYNVEMVQVPQSYNGPRLKFPFTFSDIDVLIRAYKNQQVLHAHYVLEVLFETKKALKKMPNLTYTNSSPFKDITICGDLHGHLDDLLLVFHKNGLPSETNSYVFNGDFVDRGKNSIEILMILFVSFLVYPNNMHLNRGNHEDFMMNIRYGFSKEVLHKYKVHGRKILEVLEEVYSWLPVGTIIDKQILVVHGGISESTDLNLLNRIQRSKLKSVLMPPLGASRNRLTNLTDSDEEATTSGSTISPPDLLPRQEWEQIIDLLWSDPKGKNGCYPNTSRGGGCYFGPDVTAKFLNKYHLKMIIRSHECKPDGYDICHDGKVITVFSASNYYEDSSNRGAYIKLAYGMMLRFFQYRVAGASCLIHLSQRIHTLERNAIRILKAKIISRRSDLISAFYLRDYSKSGKISVAQWAFTVENTLGLNLPWRALSPHLVNIDSDGNVDYMSCFEDVKIENSPEKMKTPLIETMYRYRSDLKLIFNLIHCDHSGLISMKTFLAMWKIFSSHYSVCIDDFQVDELANTMDLNEFFKTFYVVHKHDKLNT